MFSVKWEKEAIGYEEVFSVKRVWVRREQIPEESTFNVEMQDGTQTTYQFGTFYVMNENGKTVAVYHFPQKEIAQDEPHNH